MAFIYSGKVNGVGPTEDESVLIQISGLYEGDPTKPVGPTWFKAHPLVKREMLSTALTAVSTGHRITAAVADGYPVVEFGQIDRLYVFRP